MHDKMTFSPLKVTFSFLKVILSRLKVTFSELKVMNTNLIGRFWKRIIPIGLIFPNENFKMNIYTPRLPMLF